MREGPRTPEDDPPYEIDFYEDDAGRKPALEWLQGLERRQRRIVGTALREILEHQGINICSTSFGRQLGEGLFEFRLREDELLVRMFCHAHGQRLVLLLGGYDRGRLSPTIDTYARLATALGFAPSFQRGALAEPCCQQGSV